MWKHSYQVNLTRVEKAARLLGLAYASGTFIDDVTAHLKIARQLADMAIEAQREYKEKREKEAW
jgi:ribosomal protein L20